MEEGVTSTGWVLTQKMKVAALAHFQNGVPIDRLNLSPQQKDIIARVEHVYWQYIKNPFLDVHALFYQISKQRAARGMKEGRCNAYNYARIDEMVFQFVIDNSKPASRKEGELKVRAATDRLMRMGMESDNDRALAKGAELRMKLDRLDQPENEQADMNRAAFLPPVVVTNVHEVDDTKENLDDEQTRRIMEKYGGYVDEKRTMIEDKVKLLEAESYAANRNESEHKQ